MQSGIQLTLEDINTYDLEMLPFVRVVYDELQNEMQKEEMKKAQQNMPKPRRR